MAKRAAFIIPSLLAAGFTPAVAIADAEATRAGGIQDRELDIAKNVVTSIDESHTFTLAQHRSHQSHHSHGSHQSHRSYSHRLMPGEGPAEAMAASAVGRNESSVPANSILPSSPAIAKKLKVLPGNSEKFQKLITRAQLALLARGYDVGAVDGEMHARTIAAIYQYQTATGLIPSGKMTNETLSSLGIVAQ